MRKFNKATAAALSGALVTIIVAFWPINNEVQGALHTIITTILVWWVANEAPLTAKDAAKEVLEQLRNGRLPR